MKISFDPNKDATNLAQHEVSLALAEKLEWESALIWPDLRHDYRELRQCALVLLEDRLYFVAFTDRPDEGRRIISLRKANRREVRRYVRYIDQN
jgi:uncharacterized protein